MVSIPRREGPVAAGSVKLESTPIVHDQGELVVPQAPFVGRTDKPGFVPPSAFAAKLPLCALVGTPLPDPGAVKHGALYTMVGTSNESGDTFPIFQAPNRDGPWTRVKDSMGKPMSVFSAMERPAWISTTAPDRWAPELHEVDGRWLCIYTARHVDGDLRVAVAVAHAVTGPFHDLGPVLSAPHGVIDATVVRDRKSGQWTMVYKLDDNSVQKPTPILARPFALVSGSIVWRGEAHEICRSGEGHGGLLEGPWLVHENGTTFITLSSDYYGGAAYKTWIGSIDDLASGKVRDLRPLLTTDSPCLRRLWMGPGHNSLVPEAPGIYSMYFHAWPTGTEDTSDWNQRFDRGERRVPLRVTLAFIDERGEACAPYIVEDRMPG